MNAERWAALKRDPVAYQDHLEHKKEQNKRYRERHRRKQAAYHWAWRKYYRGAAAAHEAVHRAKLPRPDRCTGCGRIGPVEAHHLNYSLEERLNVAWLCRSCHREFHANHKIPVQSAGHLDLRVVKLKVTRA